MVICVRPGRVIGSACQQVKRVGQESKNGGKRSSGAGRAAGEIDDQGGTGGPTDPTAERSVGGVAKAVSAHEFGETFDQAITDQAGGLRGDIAGS